MKKFWKTFLSFWFLIILRCSCCNSIYDVIQGGSWLSWNLYSITSMTKEKKYIKLAFLICTWFKTKIYWNRWVRECAMYSILIDKAPKIFVTFLFFHSLILSRMSRIVPIETHWLLHQMCSQIGDPQSTDLCPINTLLSNCYIFYVRCPLPLNQQLTYVKG